MPQGLFEGFQIGQNLIPSIGDAAKLMGEMARSKLYGEYAKEAQQNREIAGQFRKEFGQDGAVPKTPLAEAAQTEQTQQEWQMPGTATPPPDPRDVALQKWNQDKTGLQQQMMRLSRYVGSVPLAKSQYDVLDKQYKEKERVEKEAETDIKDLEKRLKEQLDSGWITSSQAKKTYTETINANPILDMKYGKHAKDVNFSEKALETTTEYTAEQIESSPALKKQAADLGITDLRPGQKISWTFTHTGNPDQPIKYTKAKVGPDAAEGKNQTQEQLTDIALHDPDPAKRKRAQETKDQIQKDKLQQAAAGRAIIDAGKSKEIDIPSMAESVSEGHDARMAIRGSMGNPVASKVQTEVLKKYPKFDFMMSDANYKWKQSATNQRTINFAGGALPRLTRLDDQLRQMPNVNLNTINRIMRAASVETGKPEYTNFESNRNAIVQEINTALSGSSTTSDMRVKIELDNLKTARSPAQIKGAITNLREALIARLDVDLSPIYPIEVIQGKKTMQQYKDEMFQKYRGNYDAEGKEKAAPSGFDMDAIAAELEKRKANAH